MCNGGYQCALVMSTKLDSASVVVDLFRAKYSRLSRLFKDIIGAATINKVKFWCAKKLHVFTNVMLSTQSLRILSKFVCVAKHHILGLGVLDCQENSAFLRRMQTVCKTSISS